MSINPVTPTENNDEQPTSRPSSAGSNHEDEQQLRFETRLSTANEEESKQSNNTQPIIWDDPFELLTTNGQTGRIGISADTLPNSPTSRCMRKMIQLNFYLFICSFKRINFTNSNSITKTTR
jgi:hypothetical protein